MAQSLMEQLQLGAIDGSTRITDLLRKAKLVAVTLKASDFASWVELEMSGYQSQTTVPDYRMLPVQTKFLNPVHGWCPVMGHGFANRKKAVGQPVGQLLAITEQSEDAGYLTMAVPSKVADRLRATIGFDCDIQDHLSAASVRGIFDAVRNEILNWALTLAAAGVQGEGITFTPAEARAAQQVINNFHAPVAAFAQNDARIRSVVQTIAPTVDLAEVGRLLGSAMVEWPESARKQAAAAEAALLAEASSAAPDQGWMRAALGKAGQLAQTVSGGVATQTLLAYLKSQGLVP